MRSSRKALRVFVLVLALASTASAGDIQNPVAPPTPLTANGDIQHPVTATGEIHTGVAESTSGAADTLTGTALSLLQSVLSLF